MFVSSEATILHADVDSFFASVEQRDDPRLRGRPVIVGGWVVLAASYEAKAAGVRTAMSARGGAPPLPRARRRRSRGCARTRRRARRCSRSSRTRRRSSRGSRSTRRFSTCAGCERIAGSPAEIAARLRRDVRERVGLPITVGVARTKFLAKVASGVAKPDGLLVVAARPRARVPASARRSSGSGASGRRRPASCTRCRITTVGEVARLSEETLVALLGRASGRQLYALAHNHDARRVRPGRRRGSIGAQRALGRSSAIARGTRRRRSWRSSTASPGGCGRPGGSGGRSSCGCASTTSRARRGPTRCRARRPQTHAILGRRGDSSRRRSRRSSAQGLTLVGIAVANLETTTPCSSRCRSPATAGCARLRGRRGARPLRHRGGITGGVLSAGTAGSRCRICRIEGEQIGSKPARHRDSSYTRWRNAGEVGG